jgi:very-short-patch-repair endonuclease
MLGAMTARRPLPYYLAQGAFTISQAAEHGLSRGRMRAADLDRPFRGVRSAGLDLDDLVQRCRAAVVFMNDREAFSHSTALGLWNAPLPAGLGLPDAAVHIGTFGSTRRRRSGVNGHRLAEGTPICLSPDGLPTVAPATAWCQMASQRGDLTETRMLLALVSVADHLVTGKRRRRGGREQPTCRPQELRDAVAVHGARRGARVLAEALTLMRVGVDSPKETELRLELCAAGLGEPEVGRVIHTRIGPLTPDLAYPHRRVLIEYEGDLHRENRRRWRGDFERVRAFQEAGWTVIRVNSDDLSDGARRAALIHQLRALLS